MVACPMPSEIPLLATRLAAVLHLAAPPISIGFTADGFPELAPFGSPVGELNTGGRVPAGCVFWMHATVDQFATAPADHENCSVGSVTHGLLEPGEVVGRSDVAELVGSGWVAADVLGLLPRVNGPVHSVAYGPAATATFPADVVLIRVNARQLMVLSDAVGDLEIGGKPQCHIVALAKEQQKVAASVGCALSRQRTGMRPEEMTCAIPALRLAEVVEAVEATAAVDTQVAKYAAADARRFRAPIG
jgi:uncharacterized protein (DUF169 family)